MQDTWVMNASFRLQVQEGGADAMLTGHIQVLELRLDAL